MIAWDERRNLAIAGDKNQTLTFCADQFLEIYHESVKLHGSFCVALSGGSTPKALFSILTNSPYREKFDWGKVHLFWGDERSVGPDSPDSNYHMAMKAGFANVGIPSSQIHRMVAEKEIEKNAIAYEQLLQEKLQGRPFDFIMLGMGEDGHTASLFPGTKGLDVQGRSVIANYVPQKDTWRMSFTFDCINAARHISIYVLGESKQSILKMSLNSKSGMFPIEKVGTPEHKAVWIADKSAAHLLSLDI